jgi:hypothetical protein
LNENKIQVITDLKNINKDGLLMTSVKNIVVAYAIKITELFETYGINNFYKIFGKNYVINIIRSFATQCGYNFLSKQKKI